MRFENQLLEWTDDVGRGSNDACFSLLLAVLLYDRILLAFIDTLRQTGLR